MNVTNPETESNNNLQRMEKDIGGHSDLLHTSEDKEKTFQNICILELCIKERKEIEGPVKYEGTKNKNESAEDLRIDDEDIFVSSLRDGSLDDFHIANLNKNNSHHSQKRQHCSSTTQRHYQHSPTLSPFLSQIHIPTVPDMDVGAQ